MLNSELPRKSQEQLLNNINEGVFIVDKKESKVCFMNKAAIKISKRLHLHHSGADKSNKSIFNQEKAQFELIDRDWLKRADHQAMTEVLNDGSQSFKSINDIIQE